MGDTVRRYANTDGQTITATFQATPLASSPVPTVAYYSDATYLTLVSGPTDMTMVSANVWTAPVPNLPAQTLYIDYAYKTTVGGTLLHNQDDVLVLAAADVLSGDALATLDEFKAMLNAKLVGTTADAELQRYLDAATPVVEWLAGPVNLRTVVELRSGDGSTAFLLRQTPVAAVTSITEYAGTVGTVLTQVANPGAATASSFTVDLSLGAVIRRGSGGDPVAFAVGTDNVVITYTAGLGAVPSNLKMAALTQAAHMFQKSQQGGRPQLNATGADGYMTGWGYGIPNAVREYVAGNKRLPGLG
jgi:hypothetical protein